jgi:hypothetical protein
MRHASWATSRVHCQPASTSHCRFTREIHRRRTCTTPLADPLDVANLKRARRRSVPRRLVALGAVRQPKHVAVMVPSSPALRVAGRALRPRG